MKTFRFKIFASYLVLLLIFLSFMFPFVTNSVQRLVIESMNDRANELIETLKDAPDNKSLAQTVKDQAYLVFFHVALIDDEMQVIYDSHTKRHLNAHVIQSQKVPRDVSDALRSEMGISEHFSPLLGQKLVYVAKSFYFHEKKYIIRLAFPYEYIHELKKKFEIGLIVFSSLILILFSAMTGLVLFHFLAPVRQIIRAIKPYQEGKASIVPEIHIRAYLHDEFSDLAKTLNSLTARIRNQIDTLTTERNEKEAILESLAEGVLAVDADKIISYANAMALRFLCLEHVVIGGKLPPNIHVKCKELITRTLEENQVLNDEITIESDGKTLHLNIVASPRKQSGGAILVLQDKSIHYKILEMRKEFIANASHELKTPITIIRGFAETLHDNPDLPKETVQDITARIVRNSQRMTKIIKNLLTLADIENLSQATLQTCNLVELAKQCIHHLKTIHPHIHITIEQDGKSHLVEADPELLEVALMNLLDNAAKYSKKDPEIIVKLEETPLNVQLSVRDHGIGIPESDLEHIFERFYTVNRAESKKRGGSGLGLSIVDTIVKKHSGTVLAESTVGVGSAFTIELPKKASV